jgi:glycosyltransferase involved in cell wall biosynthesis
MPRSGYSSAIATPCGEEVSVQPGALDGITIMRYAHAYRNRTSGGVEQYLRLLNAGLLKRHRMTILQVLLATDESDFMIETQDVGVGRIVTVPVPYRLGKSALSDLPKKVSYICRQTFRTCQQEGRAQYGTILSAILQNLLRHRGGHLRYNATILSDRLPKLLDAHQVDLLALHWLSYDVDSLISRAQESNLPFALINHFNNTRFLNPQMQRWTDHAAAIGSVSVKGVPDELRNRCFNLSDAVDIEFFDPIRARPVALPDRPIIFLPARIQVGKGHQDLIEVARILIAKDFAFVLCFAGAVDSAPLSEELGKTAAEAVLEGRILFLGEKNAEEIRDLYARASIVVLPSYSEGLPRVLLEAQAMKKPVVAYDCGGVSEAVLTNRTGFLIKTGDVGALAAAIGSLLEHGEERLRMGEEGREFVSRQFSVAALVRRHEAFYCGALSGTR